MCIYVCMCVCMYENSNIISREIKGIPDTASKRNKHSQQQTSK